MFADKRSHAEIRLYELIMALKENYQKHPLLHTFCRIVSLVKVPSPPTAGPLPHHSPSLPPRVCVWGGGLLTPPPSW